MKKIILSIVYVLALHFVSLAQTTIAQARAQDTGTVATIKGICLNGSELGTIRYIQDATGGLPAFQTTGAFITTVKRGDIVTVTGKLKNYSNLLELDPVQSFAVESSNNTLPAPLVVTPLGVNEANEAKLVRVENATFATGGTAFAGNTAYTYTAGGETGKIYVRNGSPLVGTTIPIAVVSITGLASQFNATYQLLPRDAADITVGAAFFATTPPTQKNITNAGFSIDFQTNLAGTSQIRYGTSATALTNQATGAANVTNHTVTINGLQPAEFYYVQGYSVKGTDTAKTNVILCSTASNSTGVIKVYFNQSIDPSFAVGGAAPVGIGATTIQNYLISLIDAAQTSVDVALYNNDQTALVDVLKAAHNRGVRVRYLADKATANQALTPPPPFLVLKGNINGLMHNKFVVIDAGSVNNSWVMTGTMNFTTQNMFTDFNSSLFIQDQSLAKTYVKEFEEMWGTNTASPDIFAAKFGADKTDNTPHRFKIGTIDMECFFSPSDGPTQALVDVVNTANVDLEFETLTFTMNAIGTAVKDRKVAGVNVRGMIEQINDQGSEFAFFQTNGVNVKEHTLPGSLHHKTCIVDATVPASNPTVATGSHNWSASAETRNDENLVIIHDAKIANIFLQEFEKRWAELLTGVPAVANIEGLEIVLSPNPATNYTTVTLTANQPMSVKMTLYSQNGQLVKEFAIQNVNGIMSQNIEVNQLSAGNYFLMIENNGQIMARKFIKN